MQLAAFAYTSLFSSLSGGDLSFAVCNAGECHPETEKVLNPTFAVSNNQCAVSKNMNRAVAFEDLPSIQLQLNRRTQQMKK